MNAKKWLVLIVAGLLMNGALSPVDSPRWTLFGGALAEAAPQPIDINFFYEELTPYGEWRPYEPYGWVWYPEVDDHWRPYTTGYWAFTDDYGWVWVSSEPWGWIVFHYGRWFFDEDQGSWAWAPGMEWGPAWVSWRSGDGFVGWAPLPPRARFIPGIGLSSQDLDYEVGSYAWCFVPMPLFLSTRIEQVIVPPPRNVTIIHNTVNMTHYTVINQRVVNHGIDVRRLEREARTPVIRYRILDVDRPTEGRHSRRDNVVSLFRPRVVGKAHGVPPPPSGFAPRPAPRDASSSHVIPRRTPREPRTGFPDRDPGDFVTPHRGERYTPEKNHPVDAHPPVNIPHRPRPPRDDADRTLPPQPWTTTPYRPRPPGDDADRTSPPQPRITTPPHRPRPTREEGAKSQPSATAIPQQSVPPKAEERPRSRPRSEEVMDQIRRHFQ